MGKAGKWENKWSEVHGIFFWRNVETDKKVWELPEGAEEVPGIDCRSSEMEVDKAAVQEETKGSSGNEPMKLDNEGDKDSGLRPEPLEEEADWPDAPVEKLKSNNDDNDNNENDDIKDDNDAPEETLKSNNDDNNKDDNDNNKNDDILW